MLDLSVIIPAHNEELHLTETVRSVRRAFSEINISLEIIVVDDASTDQTAAIAERLEDVRLVTGGDRNIAATRNRGAKEALGKYFLFLDADTHITTELASELHEAIEKNIGAGGSLIAWQYRTTRAAALSIRIWNRLSRTFQWAAGSFVFARRDVFEKSGGFDEQFFASEELHFSQAAKKIDSFVILKGPAYTSPRKVEHFTNLEIAGVLFHMIISPKKTVRNRDKLDIWYKRRD